MKFTATCVSCRTQDGVIVLGFADDEFEPTRYVLLQKSLRPSRQDRELGHDRPHIEIHDPCRSGYGGVTKAHLQRHGLILTLALPTAAEWSFDTVIEIGFHVSDETFTEIAAGRTCLPPDGAS